MNRSFSKWFRWLDRNQLGQILKFPGLYAIALSDKNLASTPFCWSQEIIYIGMTNSKRGLKSRLQQFENTIKGKHGHGGAMRVCFKHPDYHTLVSKLFVSVSYTECNVESNKPSDLRLMGQVAHGRIRMLRCFCREVWVFARI